MTCFLRHNSTLESCKGCGEEGVMHVSQRHTDMNCLRKDIKIVTTTCEVRIHNFQWEVWVV
jgi:hypothetical protein